MGRRKLKDKRDIGVGDLYDYYMSDASVTIAETGAKFGLSERTVRRYFKDAGLPIRRGMKPGAHKKVHTGAIHRFIQEHPNAVLPRSPKAIAEMIPDATYEAAKQFRKRERKKFYERIANLPDLRETGLTFKKKDPPRVYALKDFSRYYVLGDWESGLLRITGDHAECPGLCFQVRLDQIETTLGLSEPT
jgi:AraC-like DNA-binding protein